jgi:hypothetical protein
MIQAQIVATLALGLRPRQGLARLRAKKEPREAHCMLPGVPKSVREWTLTLSNELPCWELESQWIPKSSKCDCRDQNPLAWKVLYIIGKLSKRKCLKWDHITHLEIWNTSYDQKKGQESNWQFDFRPLKVRNQPDFRACKQCATYRWKCLDKGYNFSWNLIAIKGLHAKLWGPKVVGIPTLGISGLPTPTWESRDKMPFGCGPRGEV